MDGFFATLKPSTDEQRNALATARQLSESIVETHYLMSRQLRSPIPDSLLISVVCWATLVFSCVGAVSKFNALAMIVELLGGGVGGERDLSHPRIQSALCRLLQHSLGRNRSGHRRAVGERARQRLKACGPLALERARAWRSASAAARAARSTILLYARTHARKPPGAGKAAVTPVTVKRRARWLSLLSDCRGKPRKARPGFRRKRVS